MSDVLSKERIERISEHMMTAFERSGDSQGYCLDTAMAEGIDDLLRERDALLGLLERLWLHPATDDEAWEETEAALTKTGRLT